MYIYTYIYVCVWVCDFVLMYFGNSLRPVFHAKSTLFFSWFDCHLVEGGSV